MAIKLKTLHSKDLPPDLLFILNKLNENNFPAYLVGGAVRDMLLGKTVHDYDICTAARPDEVKNIFSQFSTIDSGLKYGTVAVIINKNIYEITSFRSDGVYLDHRHPEGTILSRSLKEDTARRDFTINQIAFSPTEGIVDYHGGISDLSHGIIRTVGDPHRRFHEDALRILRALRFACNLGFTIEAETLEACQAMISDLDLISGERIQQELKKLLASDFSQTSWAYTIPLWQYLLPEELDSYINNFNWQCFKLLKQVEKPGMPETSQSANSKLTEASAANFILRFLLLTYTADLDKLKPLLERLKLSKIENKVYLNYYLALQIKFAEIVRDQVSLLKFQNKLELDLDTFLRLKAAAELAQNNLGFTNSADFVKAKFLLQEIKAKNLPLNVSQLAISGQDLQRLGYKQGPDIGIALQKILAEVQSGHVANSKEELLKLAASTDYTDFNFTESSDAADFKS